MTASGLVAELAPLLQDFPGSGSTAPLDEHADRVLGMVGGTAPADLLEQATVQVLGDR